MVLDGWVGGWMDGRARLRISYSNQKTVIFIKFKLIMIIISSEAKSNTSVWFSSKYCNPAIGTILKGGEKTLVELKPEALI